LESVVAVYRPLRVFPEAAQSGAEAAKCNRKYLLIAGKTLLVSV